MEERTPEGMRCNMEVYAAPGLVLICSFAKAMLTGKKMETVTVISLKEFSSTGLLVFPSERNIGKPRMKDNMV